MAMLSIALMFFDSRTSYLDPVRLTLGVIATPIHWVASIPTGIGRQFDLWLESEESVRAVYEELLVEQAQLKLRLQSIQALEFENQELRRVLEASQRFKNDVIVAELVEVSLDPYVQKVLVNKGGLDGVYVGQPAFNAQGILGQVTKVMPTTSSVTLITDPSHALPVQVKRDGLRAIARGVGRPDELQISYLGPNVDIREGDILVSSGLGGRFPSGYPVAEVAEVLHDSGELFLKVSAKPLSNLSHGKYVMLVWHGATSSGSVKPR